MAGVKRRKDEENQNQTREKMIDKQTYRNIYMIDSDISLCMYYLPSLDDTIEILNDVANDTCNACQENIATFFSS